MTQDRAEKILLRATATSRKISDRSSKLKLEASRGNSMGVGHLLVSMSRKKKESRKNHKQQCERELYSDARAEEPEVEIWRALTHTQQDKVQDAPALDR
jgi:hypothetical protein